MKKLLFLLAAVGMIFTACEGGESIEEANGGAPFDPEITISPDELSFPVEGGEQEVAITANFEYKVSEKADWLSVEQTETGLLVKVDKSERVENRYADIVLTNKEYEVEKFISVSQAAFEPSITIKPSSATFSANGGEQEIIITSNVEYEVSKKADWLSVEQTETGLLVTAKESKTTSERSAYISIINEKYSITKTIDIVQEAWVPKIELAQQSVEVEFEPAEYEVGVTSPYSWEATTKNDWIVVESKTGIAGEEKLKFTTLRNEEEQERKGTITLKNTDYNLVAELYVTQKAFVPAITIESESLLFAFEGGTQEVAITANFEEYEYSTNTDWLTIEKSEKGLKVTASNHTEVKERTAEITISNEKYGISKVVNVTQGAFVSAITIEPESLLFTFEGGTQEVVITANFEEYEYSTNADWLTVEKSENGISVTVPNYVEVEERTAEITISNEKYGVSKVISVTQGAFVPEWTIEPESLTFAVEGGTQEVAVTANFDEYEFSTNVDWLTIEKSDKGVNITATPNAKFEERTAKITISSEKYGISKAITIMQQGVSAESQNVILYTSSDGKIVTPYKSDVFGANIVSNTYRDGQGLIIFDAPVTSIGEDAFYKCSSLTSVTIPDSVTSIGIWAFCGCTSLTSVTIPDSVTKIGWGAFYNCTSLTSVTIPNSVTSIGNDAFYECNSLTSVTIGNSVTSIGESAFNNCTSLTSVTIGNSITSIGKYAFYGCKSLKAFYGKFASSDNRCLIIDDELKAFAPAELTEYTIPNSVTSIGGHAFSGCSSLTSVTIPDSVTSIGYNVFYGCTGELIVNCNIPSASSYNNGAFYGSKFTKVTIGNSVTSIGDRAFYNCTSLTSVTIPDSVTSIGDGAFDGCTSLMSITIPNSVTSIGEKAFANCDLLLSVTIPSSVTTIGEKVFQGCTGELIIDNPIIENDYASSTSPTGSSERHWLYGSLFSKIVIGDNVKRLGNYALYGYASMQNMSISDSVTSIGNYAFISCTSLTSVTIPDSVTSIGNYAFISCTSLTSVTIPDSVTSIGDETFGGCSSLISITIPDGVTSIGRLTFYNCTSLISITIPDSVTSIGERAFYNCDSLMSITIPNSVTSIGEKAFANCDLLLSVTIPDSVTSIGREAFYKCTSLTSVTIGNSVTSIGYEAFSSCTSLKSVYCKPTTPPAGSYHMFDDNAIERKIYVPKDSMNKYKNAEYWSVYSSAFILDAHAQPSKREIFYTRYNTGVGLGYDSTAFGANIVSDTYDKDKACWVIKFDNDITKIGNYAFRDCTSLQSITIPDSVTSIGNYAFKNCTSLTSITIPDSVTSIGDGAFDGCTSLTSVTIGNGVTSIGWDAFMGCTSLKSITIGNSVTRIGESAFYNCTSLTGITIPNSVTWIGWDAFMGCTSLTAFYGKFASADNRCLIVDGVLNSFAPAGLTKYTIPDSVTSIRSSVFKGCSSLTSVTIPDSVTSIGREAFYKCTALKEVNCKPTTPPVGSSTMFDNNAADRKIYVPVNSVSAYKSAEYWKNYASYIVGYDF